HKAVPRVGTQSASSLLSLENAIGDEAPLCARTVGARASRNRFAKFSSIVLVRESGCIMAAGVRQALHHENAGWTPPRDVFATRSRGRPRSANSDTRGS